MKFSPRLQLLFNEFTPGVPVVDLCCDHGYLGLHAYLTELFPEILFVDQVPFSMMNLEKNFHQYFKKNENPTLVNFITSDAGKVQTILTGNVVIAGVGGNNMMKILEGLHQNKRLKPKKLILSPHKHPEKFEKPELFGLSLSHTLKFVESRIERTVFIFQE